MPSLRPLLRTEASGAAKFTARAFAYDPLFVHLFPDDTSRQRQIATMYSNNIRRLYLPHGLAMGASPEASGEIEAVALWLTPGDHAAAERACLPALRRASGLHHFAAVRRTFDAFDRVFPTGDFYYLSILATAPEAQGQGLGSALVRDGIARADRNGVGCYLETATEANVAFYQRFGFEVIHEIPLPARGPMNWGLWRDSEGRSALL